MVKDIDYDKLLEELKVMQNRITAIQGIIIRLKEAETKEKMKKFDKVK